VERLERSGLVVSSISGRSRFVESNRSSPIYRELRGLLAKSMGPERFLRSALSELDGIEHAFIFGSWADPEQMAPQDIDLMVIGDPDLGRLYDSVSSVEAEVGRPINVVVRSQDEWDRADGAFEQAVRSRPRIELISCSAAQKAFLDVQDDYLPPETSQPARDDATQPRLSGPQ
jgi:predicted nucleotidyltransferase